MAGLIRKIKTLVYRMAYAIRRKELIRQGWVISHNVLISMHGVRKIGHERVHYADNMDINAGCMIIADADIHIGRNSTLAYRTLLTTNANPNAPHNELCRIYPPRHDAIWIGDNVWVGACATILPGCRIGNNSVIAAGSVVCNDVPDNVMVAGVPAKIKKQISF